MTLLESLAALVILGSTAVGFLEVFHTTARVTRDASEWARITAHAESVMEGTKLESAADAAATSAPAGTTTKVDTRPWAPGVTEVVVVVTTQAGRRLELRRLTRNGSAASVRGGGTPR